VKIAIQPKNKLLRIERSFKDLDLRNLQDESLLPSSDSSCKFFIREDLLGKIQVYDFIVHEQ